jgi:diguanylate cyclase (GGDEF)-like protein/excisionase family DNA binding protein
MKSETERPKWLRMQQAADLLDVSPSTVRRWAADGMLACRLTPGGQRRFLRGDLATLVPGAAARPASRPKATGGGSGSGAGHDTGGPAHRSSSGARHSRGRGGGERYQLLFETSLELASSLEIGEVLQSAARRLSAALQIPDCDIYRLEDDGRIVCIASTVLGARDDTWVGEAVSLERWPCKRLAVETGGAICVSSLDDPRLSRDERENMHGYRQRSCVSLPLVARDKVIGLVGLLDRAERRFTAEEISTAEAVCQLVALALERARLYEEVKSLHLGNLRALSSALSAKDYYTLGHASRVAAYMALLSQELGWPDERLEEVENAAFLHDVGKIGVSDRVLLKGGPLTSEEWELVRQHPGISAEIVRPLFDRELVAGVRHHHERFDGGGYPDGLAGQEIPLIARAMCVVDCYDAMSCRRPYRPALSYRQCLAELRRCVGTQFDPEMVEAFLRVLRRLRRRRTRVATLARQAATLVDPEAHALLHARTDEASPAYVTMVAALRRLRDEHPPVRFVTSFALRGDQCITVLDTGDTEDQLSRCGDPWLPEDELARVLAGEGLVANVLNADDFGVWVSGIAPLRDPQGAVVGAVSVDAPIVASLDRSLQGDRSHTLAAMLQSAAIRFSRAEVEAITDGLTGLYNHRYLHERLEEELERAARRETTLSLLFCDCDCFKAYNDAYGHKAGDAALARIARIIEARSRRIDLAARYGGEEFVLVLVDTDAADALAAAERIRAEVEASNNKASQPLTVSVGVATCPRDASARDELLDKADWAMYAAKRAGRNRVLAFGDGLVAKEQRDLAVAPGALGQHGRTDSSTSRSRPAAQVPSAPAVRRRRRGARPRRAPPRSAARRWWPPRWRAPARPSSRRRSPRRPAGERPASSG